MPALPLLLTVGVISGDPAAGAIAAGAAFTVGFGASRHLHTWRWGAMSAATLGIVLATVVGLLVGSVGLLAIVTAAAASAACAWLALYDEDLWWVALQIAITLFIASYFSAGHLDVPRIGAVLLGGSTQIVFVTTFARLFPVASKQIPVSSLAEPPSTALCVRHACRAAGAVTAALLMMNQFHLANAYWAAMTALLVLKPGLRETRVRGVERIAGTAIGCIAAALYVDVVGPRPTLLILGFAAAAASAFALQKAHYASLTTAVTATVILLVTLGDGTLVANVEHRLVATLVGGVFALLAAQVVLPLQRSRVANADRVGIRKLG